MCWLDSSGKRSSRCAETRIRLYARAPRCRSLCCSIWLVSSLCCTAVCVFRLWSILHSLPLFTSTSANSSDTNTFTPGDLAFPGLLFLYFIHHHMHSSHTHTHTHTLSLAPTFHPPPPHRWLCPDLTHIEAGSSHCPGPRPLKRSSGRFHRRPSYTLNANVQPHLNSKSERLQPSERFPL